MNAANNNHPLDAAEPLDKQDFHILQGVRGVYEAIDPMPADLLDNIRFAIVLQDLDSEFEIARETSELPAMMTRGGDDRRLITFECTGMTIIVGVRVNGDDTVRLDGWLTPPGAYAVELRALERAWTTESDEKGRFALDGVPRGTAYLTVRTAARSVTTSTIRL